MKQRRAGWVVVASLVGCGDNLTTVGPPVERADTLLVVAHPDDDLIFMQPELLLALRAGTSTTVYVTTAGAGRATFLFAAARTAYGAVAGSQDWECGTLELEVASGEHCRLRDRPVSLINLYLPDGGIDGDRRDTLLHLVDGTVDSLSVQGPVGGTVTMETVIEGLADVIEVTAPVELHTLDLSAAHGRDHSSHLFVASFVLWAAARVGFAGAMTWHRGYNVAVEAPTLTAEELAAATSMLGYYEACADGCGPCGSSCAVINPAHETWLGRQYASTRVSEVSGRLRAEDRCLTDALELGDCAAAPTVELDRAGHLLLGGRCLATTASGDVGLETCGAVPEQYWAFDTEGYLWNGRPPEPSANMAYDHVRCLGSAPEVGAPTCGDQLRPRWQLDQGPAR
ncbi:MAG: PIG-L family deacetylase [Deltaproteobacteria bacterium]|nr:PIG-L family deacetylase [Deltaproteobacteria bacterium]